MPGRSRSLARRNALPEVESRSHPVPVAAGCVFAGLLVYKTAQGSLPSRKVTGQQHLLEKTRPQRLKPNPFPPACGTTEVVP
jgi:hypothetical protein